MKEQSSMRSWSHKPSSQQKQSGAATAATTRRAKHWLGDVVADTQSEQAGKDQEAPRDSTQKAKYENLMGSSCHQISRPPCNRAAAFNRRMRKTARPVVWEGA